ncbi:MAG TPA: hypothetical protein PKD16_11280 [Saprospiraceae bacterium]|jgi:hypothetical protein|nr:hypothetical protein [Saprospiraceae bacterium]HMT70738.1 hypothetical protein [Saprospiraceae bacterium]
MDNEIIIEFSRSKEEEKKLLFTKLWIRQIIPNILLTFLLIQASYLVGTIFGVAISMGLGIDGGSQYFFIILMIIILLNFFFAPIYKFYFIYRNQVNEIYKNHNLIHHKFRIYENSFEYENEYYKLDVPWLNTANLKIDSEVAQFEIISPNIYIWVPTIQISKEAQKYLMKKIYLSKPNAMVSI